MRNLVPGYRYFKCEECKHEFKFKTRDSSTPSLDSCPLCNEDCFPYKAEEHPEWLTDIFGNLKNE